MSGAAGGGELVWRSRRRGELWLLGSPPTIDFFSEIGKILLVKVKVCVSRAAGWFGEAISPRRNDMF